MNKKTLKQGSVFVYRAITAIILNGEQVEAVQVEAVTRGGVLKNRCFFAKFPGK